MTAIVVNKHHNIPYDVYIGRGSIWGNPYSHMEGTKALYKVSTREEAIESYKKYLWNRIKNGIVTKEDLISLDGKVLGCYCKPKACHGDILIKAIEWAKR